MYYNSTNPMTTTKLHTPIVLPQSRCTIECLDYSHISVPALELHSRALPSVGVINAQSVLTQGEIPGEGRTEKKIKVIILGTNWKRMIIRHGSYPAPPRTYHILMWIILFPIRNKVLICNLPVPLSSQKIGKSRWKKDLCLFLGPSSLGPIVLLSVLLC